MSGEEPAFPVTFDSMTRNYRIISPKVLAMLEERGGE